MEKHNNFYTHLRLIQLANMVMADRIDQEMLDKLNEFLNNVEEVDSLEAVEASANNPQNLDTFVTSEQLVKIRERKIKQKAEREAIIAKQAAKEVEVETVESDEVEQLTPKRAKAKSKTEATAE